MDAINIIGFIVTLGSAIASIVAAVYARHDRRQTERIHLALKTVRSMSSMDEVLFSAQSALRALGKYGPSAARGSLAGANFSHDATIVQQLVEVINQRAVDLVFLEQELQVSVRFPNLVKHLATSKTESQAAVPGRDLYDLILGIQRTVGIRRSKVHDDFVVAGNSASPQFLN